MNLEANQRFLETALPWLRSRLENLAERNLTHPLPHLDKPVPFWKRRNAIPPERQIAEAKSPPAVEEEASFNRLANKLGLLDFERNVLLLCVAMELDTCVPALCARAHADPARNYPTFALAMVLFEDPAWDALSPERPLRRFRLIEINQPGALSLTASPLRADERVVNYIKGLNYLDDRLATLLSRVPESDGDLSASQEKLARDILGQAGESGVVQLLGADKASKLATASFIARERDLHLYAMSHDLIPAQTPEIETMARLWQREARLSNVALYIDSHEGEIQSLALRTWLGRCGGLIFLDTRDIRVDLGLTSAAYDVVKPTTAEQKQLWAEELDDPGDRPEQLAAQFDLNVAEIRRIARSAPEDPWNACLALTRPRLETLAQRIDAKATWDDIVLPDDQRALLRQIADQVKQRGRVYDQWGFRAKMNRGLGISALFSGDSGCGKTMAAEVIANELRLNLYRIDLSAVVSKFIGETEKNLRKLFDAAEGGGAILFFDEADALFGKRSEVKDSHDRYANIEINYLLQRMESYGGLAILATNMKSALDPAFLRRLRFVVNFQFPGPKEREQIWRKVFPPQTKVESLDHARLARLNLSGGNIHNVALNAAFLAAEAGDDSITMPRVLSAARTEFQKLERHVNEADFK